MAPGVLIVHIRLKMRAKSLDATKKSVVKRRHTNHNGKVRSIRRQWRQRHGTGSKAGSHIALVQPGVELTAIVDSVMQVFFVFLVYSKEHIELTHPSVMQCSGCSCMFVSPWGAEYPFGPYLEHLVVERSMRAPM
jgi:hypothetical protein